MVGGDTSARLKLFIVFSTIQKNDYLILAESGSAPKFDIGGQIKEATVLTADVGQK